MNFFTSDTHLAHANIIKYSNRPFLHPGDLDSNGNWVSDAIKVQRGIEMTDELIRRHNARVTMKDNIYHHGDYCFGTVDDAVSFLNRLNFNKFYFIRGNHDKAMEQLRQNIQRGWNPHGLADRIVWLGDMAEVCVEGQDIVMNHYAMRVWNRSHHGTWHTYGHSHGSLPDDPHSRSIDVGVDCHNLAPISFDELSDIMLKKKYWKPIDHHGPREEGGGRGLSKTDYEKLERKRLYAQLKEEFNPKA